MVDEFTRRMDLKLKELDADATIALQNKDVAEYNALKNKMSGILYAETIYIALKEKESI